MKQSIIQNLQTQYFADGYHYCSNSRQFSYNDICIRLTNQETKLLELLLSYNGNLVPIETIEYELWPDKEITISARRTLIYRLRNKLDMTIIETIPGVGCRLLV